MDKFSSSVRFFDHGCSVSEHFRFTKNNGQNFFKEEGYDLENIIDFMV